MPVFQIKKNIPQRIFQYEWPSMLTCNDYNVKVHAVICKSVKYLCKFVDMVVKEHMKVHYCVAAKFVRFFCQMNKGEASCSQLFDCSWECECTAMISK